MSDLITTENTLNQNYYTDEISTPNTPKTQSGNKPSQREAMISNILAMLENIEKLDTKIDKAKSYSIPTMSTKKELSNPSVTITNDSSSNVKDLKKERDKLAKKVRDKNFEELRQRNKLLTFKLNSLQESSSRYEELLKNAEDVEESTHRASDAGIATLQEKNKDLTKDYYQTLEDLKELKKENIIQERALFTYEIAIKELNREYQQVCKESGLKDPIQPLDLEEGKNEARVHRKVNRMNSADSYDDSKDRFEQDQQKLIKKQQNFEERQKNILEMKALSKALTAQLQKKDKELDQDYLTLILSNAKKEDKKSFHPKNYGKPSNRSRRGDNSSNLHISSQEVSSLRGSNSFSSSVISAPKLNRRTNSNADPFPRINSSTFSRKKMPITPKGVKKKVPRSRKKPSLVSSVIERPKSPETSHYRNNSNPGKLDEYMKMRHSSVGRKSNPGKRSLSRTKKSASINPATERPKKKRLSKVKLKDFITEVNPSNNNPKKTKPPLDDKKPKLRRVNSDKKKNSAQLSKMERINYRISKRKPTGFNPFKPSIGKSSTPTNRLGKDKAKRNPKNFSSPPKKVTRNKYEEIVEVDEEEDATKTPKAPETDLLNKKPEKEKSSIFQFNNNSSGSKDPSKERPSLGNSSPSLNNSKTNPQPKEDEIDEEKRQQFENKIKKRLEELYANKQDRPEKKMLSTIVSDRMNSQSSFNDSINVEKTNLKGSVQLLRQSSDDGPLPSKSIVSLRKSSDDIIDKPEEPNDKDKEPENDLKPKSFNRRDNKNLSVRERIKRAESPMITVTPAVAPPAEEKYPEKEPEPEEKEDPEEPSIEEKMPKKKNSFKFVLEEMNPSDPSSSSEPPHEQDLKDSKKDFVIGQEEGDSGKKTEERSSTSVKKPKKKLPINLSKAKSESLESSRKETGRSSQNNNKLDPKIGLDNVSPLASPQKQFLYDTPNLAPEKEKVTLPRKSLTLEKKKSTEKVEKVKSVRFDDESQKSRSKSPGMSTKDKKPLKQFSAFKKSSLRSQTSINNNLRRSIVGEKGNLNMDGDGDTGTKSRQIKPIFINENDSSLAGGSKGSKFDVRSVMRPPKRKETGRRSAAFTRVGKRNQDVYEPRELVVHESTSMLKTEGSHMLTQPRSEINHPTTLNSRISIESYSSYGSNDKLGNMTTSTKFRTRVTIGDFMDFKLRMQEEDTPYFEFNHKQELHGQSIDKLYKIDSVVRDSKITWLRFHYLDTSGNIVSAKPVGVKKDDDDIKEWTIPPENKILNLYGGYTKEELIFFKLLTLQKGLVHTVGNERPGLKTVNFYDELNANEYLTHAVGIFKSKNIVQI